MNGVEDRLADVEESISSDEETIPDMLLFDALPVDPEAGEGVSGATVRGVLSDTFDVLPDALEGYLREGDQVDKLNRAVRAIRDHDDLEARDDYGEILFRRGAYRYRLTPTAVDLYQRRGG